MLTFPTPAHLPPKFPRQPRGSYSKLICLACRARKIKCVLPPDAPILSSLLPQRPDKACARCRVQGLECIVERTILGRPSQKRHRASTLGDSDGNASGNGHEIVNSDGASNSEPELEEDTDVQDFVLSEVRTSVEEIDNSLLPPTRKERPSKHEIFLALVDSAHLFSALLARDAKFASLVVGVQGRTPADVLKLVDASMAKALDERLVWHRLHFPYSPTILSLHTALLTSEAKSPHTYVTQTLLALLALLALDVSYFSPTSFQSPHSFKPSTPVPLRPSLQSIVAQNAQSLLFNLPVHRHALLIYELANAYAPLALVSSPSAAASALKGNLYVTLAHQTAMKLELDMAASKLANVLHESDAVRDGSPDAVEGLVLDALRWCRALILESSLDGFVQKSLSLQRISIPEISSLLSTVRQALEAHPMSPSIVMMYHSLLSAKVEMNAATNGKQHWQKLALLEDLIITHARDSEKLRRDLSTLLQSCDDSNRLAKAEIAAINQIRTADIAAAHVRISGLALFYSLMSGLHPTPAVALPNSHEAVTAEDALKVSAEIIHHIKHIPGPPSSPTAMFVFLQQHGDPRVEQQENILRDFVAAVSGLELNGVGYQPRAVPAVSSLLFASRELVENNAARMKGWDGLHPNVDVQILLLQDCARSLSSLSPCSEALAQSGIFAAGAKLIRGLCRILAQWRKMVAEREVREAAARGAEKEVELPDEFEGVEEFLSCEGRFDDWDDWPQAEDVDFSTLFDDGSDWVNWASALLPSG